MKNFIDIPRKTSRDFIKIEEAYKSNQIDTLSTKRKLISLISKDLFYFESYILLSEIFLEEFKYRDAEIILTKAYKLSLKLLKDKNGNLPDRIDWEEESNQHILKLFKSIGLWALRTGNKKFAGDIFNKINESSHTDKHGIEVYLTAIKGGATPKDFNLRKSFVRKNINTIN